MHMEYTAVFPACAYSYNIMQFHALKVTITMYIPEQELLGCLIPLSVLSMGGGVVNVH